MQQYPNDYRHEVSLLSAIADIYLVFGIDSRVNAKKALNTLLNHTYSKGKIEGMSADIELWEHVTLIQKWMSANVPLLFAAFKSWKMKRKMHHDLTLLEQEILLECNVRCNGTGINQHDGIMVHKDSDHSIFINAFNDYVKDWDYKPVIKIKIADFEWEPNEKLYM